MVEMISISKESLEQKTLTYSELKQLKTLDEAKRVEIVKSAPFALPLLWASWKDGANINQVVSTAIQSDPSVLKELEQKDGFVATAKNINDVVLANPMSVFDLTDEQKALISQITLTRAFEKNPIVLASNCPALNQEVNWSFEYEAGSQLVTKHLSSPLKAQLQLALRIAEGVSKYRVGYCDFALGVAQKLQESEIFKQYKNQKVFVENVPTIVNAMIKQQDQRLRSCSKKTWLLNNNKVLHFAIRQSAKQDSELEGIIEDMPIQQFDKNLVERIIVAGLKTNPDFYKQLSAKEFDGFKASKNVQKAYLQSLISHNYPAGEIIASLPQAKAKDYVVRLIRQNPKVYGNLSSLGAEWLAQDESVKVEQFKSLALHNAPLKKFAKSLDEKLLKKAIIKTIKRLPQFFEKLPEYGLDFAQDDTAVQFAYFCAVQKDKKLSQADKKEKLAKLFGQMADEKRQKLQTKIDRSEKAKAKRQSQTEEETR